MPGELSDPTQSVPYHYDRRYEPSSNPANWGFNELDSFLNNLSGQVLGRPLTENEMRSLKESLEEKGFLHRNFGDESFKNRVLTYLNKMKSARKVASAWLTSIR